MDKGIMEYPTKLIKGKDLLPLLLLDKTRDKRVIILVVFFGASVPNRRRAE
jgi:hypothetical protein